VSKFWIVAGKAVTTVEIPERFWRARYDARRIPGAAAGLDDGANCQHFAYQLLAHHGRTVGALRSSELWSDTLYTTVAATMQPLDLVLFNHNADPWGAHVGICVGDDQVLHLCREIGTPVVWSLAEFAARARYAVLIGFKRPRST
jgi:hypothetical protein